MLVTKQQYRDAIRDTRKIDVIDTSDLGKKEKKELDNRRFSNSLVVHAHDKKRKLTDTVINSITKHLYKE